MDCRYALYFLPEPDTALERLGQRWLDALPAELTAEARPYGFHATLKAPFRLAPGHNQGLLIDSCAAIFANSRPVVEAPPVLARLNGFFALRPGVPSAAIHGLAAECVRRFDHFRAAPTPAETAKRLQAALNPRQRHLLERWGYPYVLDEYRFHITLTRRLDEREAAAAADLLAPLTAAAVAERLTIASVCLVTQRPGGAFTLLRRFPLGTALATDIR